MGKSGLSKPCSLSRVGAANAGIDITGKIPPKASLSPAIVNFFNCSSAVHNDFTDSGQALTGFATNTVTGAAANSVRMQSWYNNGDLGAISGGWKAPAGKDFVIMFCAQCVAGGVPSFYMGDGNTNHIRIQHYLAGEALLNTQPVTDTAPVAGKNYIYAAVYRDGVLEHYTTKSDGQTIYHANDIEVDLSSFVFDGGFNCSHGKINWDDFAAVESDQDYFGFLYAQFKNGAPSESEVLKAMQFYLTSWPDDHKAIYSNWITEL